MTELAPCNTVLIAATSLASWLAFRDPSLEARGIFEPARILAGREFYRLITCAFLHSGWRHLVWNMVSLLLFGNAVEFALGRGQFLGIYFGSVIGGSLLSLYLHRQHDYRAYGASGGVCGVILAYILLFPHARMAAFPLPVSLPAWLFAAALIGGSFHAMKTANDNVGHDAHLGGALVGLLVTAALRPSALRANWVVFVIALSAAVLLVIYLWLNPLFLPLRSFSVRLRRQNAARATRRRATLSEAEVDALLAKIAEHGLHTLTPQERTALEEVSAQYRRRAESKKPQSGLAI